jgi:hypothetical protein
MVNCKYGTRQARLQRKAVSGPFRGGAVRCKRHGGRFAQFILRARRASRSAALRPRW